MPLHLLSQVVEAKWAITPKSLQAITEVIQDHDLIASRETFHKGEMQSAIGTIGKSIEGTNFARQQGSVAILSIDGPIIPRISSSFSGPVASLEGYANDLKRLQKDESIESIVFSFDSPGGFVTGTSEFAELVRSSNKPIHGFVYGYAASAAYWIASATHELHASVTAEVGSIGTVAIFEDRSAQKEKAGIKSFEIVSNLSPNKRLSPETDEGRDEVIKTLDQITEVFIGDVAKGRNTTSENVLETFGKGKMFMAPEAKELGMIDSVTTLDNLVKELNTKTNKPMENLQMNAEEIKQQHASAHEEIFQAGVSAENARLKSIESLKDSYPEASSFIDSNKHAEGMDKGKMAVAIIEAKDEIMKSSLASVQSEGKLLVSATEEVPAAQDAVPEATANDEDTVDEDVVNAAVSSATAKHKQIHGNEMVVK